MWISKNKFKILQNHIETLQKDCMRTRNWHVCNNCANVFKRENIISNRDDFNYCGICRPIMKEKRELEIWTSTHKDEVLSLKKAINKKSKEI